MKETLAPPSYSGYRFLPEIIAHAVWLYFRFALRYRDVEGMRQNLDIRQGQAARRARSSSSRRGVPLSAA